jgi:hypothetical protein
VKVILADKILFTADLTANGFSAESMRVLKPGAKVKGIITVGAEEFPFSGEVRWAREGDPRMRQLGRMGIRFDQISPEFQRLVRGTR